MSMQLSLWAKCMPSAHTVTLGYAELCSALLHLRRALQYRRPENLVPCRYGKELTVADVEALLTRHIRQQDINFEHLAKFYPRSAAACPLLRMHVRMPTVQD